VLDVQRYSSQAQRYSCQVPVVLVKILMELEISRQILKNPQVLNFMIGPLGKQCFGYSQAQKVQKTRGSSTRTINTVELNKR